MTFALRPVPGWRWWGPRELRPSFEGEGEDFRGSWGASEFWESGLYAAGFMGGEEVREKK